MTEELTLPTSVDTERSVLGVIMLNNDAWYSSDGLTADLFSLESHRQIFGAMAAMFENSTPVDLETLRSYLADNKELSRVGGVAYLASLTDGAVRLASLKSYIKILREKQQLRTLINLMRANVERAVSGAHSSSEIAGVVQEELFALQANQLKTEARKFDNVILNTLNELQSLRTHSGDLVGFSTGVPDLDMSTTGIRPAELWIVGAYPGRGKTVLGVQIGLMAARASSPVCIFSLEMTAEQLGLRSLATCGMVPAAQLRNPRYMNESEWRATQDSADELVGLPIYVDDSGSLTARELAARTKLYIRKYGVKLVIVDYLQLVEGGGRDVRERVGRVANTLRQIAKDERVAVVAMSQLARPKSGDLNATPSMSQLRESGEIEAHAHTILLLNTPEDENGRATGKDVIQIVKQRNGPKGPVFVVMDGKSMTFKPRAVNQ